MLMPVASAVPRRRRGVRRSTPRLGLAPGLVVVVRGDDAPTSLWRTTSWLVSLLNETSSTPSRIPSTTRSPL